MASNEEKLARMQEILNRGLQDRLSPEKRAVFDEALSRGLISTPAIKTETVQELRVGQAATPIDQDFIPTAENLAIQPIGREELTIADKAVGVLEALGTMATGATGGALGFAIGSLEGALADLTGQMTPEEAQEVATRYAGFGTYEPKTEAGQRFAKGIGEKLGVLPPVLGSTPVPAITSAIPTPMRVRGGIEVTKRNIGEFLSPVGKAKTAADKGTLNKFRLPKDNGLKRKLLAEQTLAENPNIAAVTKAIQEDGSIVTRQNSVKALKVLSKELGNDEATAAVSVIENMGQGSKARYNKMLDIIQEGHDKPLFKERNRPSDVLGDAVSERAKDVIKLNEQAGKRIGAIAKNELSKSNLDISSIKQRFYDSMGELGVKLTQKEDGTPVFDFSESRFIGGNEQMINRLNSFLKSDSMNGFDAHKLKQFARELVDFGEGTESAIAANSQAPIKNLATDLNSILVNINPKYAKANKVFSDSIDVVNDFNRMIKNVDLDGDLASQSLANKARRLASNLESRAAIRQTFEQAEKVMKQHGGKTYTDNIDALNYALTKLEDSFKIEPPASIQGRMQRSGVNLMQAAASPATEAANIATEGLMSKVFGLSKPDFKKKMEAYRLLTRQGK